MAQSTLSPPAVAIFDDTLFVFGGSSAHQNGSMSQITFDLKNLIRTSTPPPGAEPIDTDALTNAANWQPQWMTIPGIPDDAPGTYSRCAAVSTSTNLYAFWNHFTPGAITLGSSQLYASQYAGGVWGTALQLLESDGATVPKPLLTGSRFGGFSAISDVSATGL